MRPHAEPIGPQRRHHQLQQEPVLEAPAAQCHKLDAGLGTEATTHLQNHLGQRPMESPTNLGDSAVSRNVIQDRSPEVP